MGRPADRPADHMAQMRAQRGPPSDPRDGRLFQQIRYAFVAHERDLTTGEVMDYCYPVQRLKIMGGFKSWHRTNTIRVLRRVAIPIGRRKGKRAGRGRPMVWRAIPELMEERSWKGRLNRKRRGQSLRPLGD